MKAIVQDTYGSADVLELRDIDTPVAGDTQVLVRIHAASIADVTGVCSTTNVELVTSIGADRVIDYAHEDFTDTDRRYDLRLDIRRTRPRSRCLRLLDPGGTYVLAGWDAGHVRGKVVIDCS